LQERHDWNSLQSIIAVTAKREIGDKVTEETRYTNPNKFLFETPQPSLLPLEK
jgi:hypothetical protein